MDFLTWELLEFNFLRIASKLRKGKKNLTTCYIKRYIRMFQAVVVLWRSQKSMKKWDARAELLCYSETNFLFFWMFLLPPLLWLLRPLIVNNKDVTASNDLQMRVP